MAKRTKKYVAALETSQALGIAISPNWVQDQEQLYRFLQNDLALAWDSKQGKWQSLANEPADPPTDVVRVRVWADHTVVERVANQVVGLLLYKEGYRLLDRSEAFPCRPPKQLESRIYLTFLPKE